jgi:hypothetical protein
MATIKKPAKKMQMGGSKKSAPIMKKGGSVKKAEEGIKLKEVTVSAKKTAPEVQNMFKNKGESSKYDYRKIDSVANKNKFFPDEYRINPKSTPRENRIKIENAINSRTDLAEMMKARLKKNGGPVKKAKSGGSFPDLNKDGKITKADILKGRGVIAKKGATLKKQAATAIAMKKAGKTPAMKSGGKMKKCAYGCK